MATYKNFEDFLPYILMEVPGCPRQVATEFVRKFVIRLCEKALIIRKKASEINITADEREYKLNFTENLYRPTGIVAATYEGGTTMFPRNEAMLDDQTPRWRSETTSTRPLYYWLTIDNKFHVHQKPTQDIDNDPITVECWVSPVRTATKVDEFVFNNYAETVAYGALSELQLMKDQSWNDPVLAQLNGRNWRQGMRNARAESLRGKDGTQSTQVYPKSYVVFG
jgi:hypothetical protein